MSSSYSILDKVNSEEHPDDKPTDTAFSCDIKTFLNSTDKPISCDIKTSSVSPSVSSDEDVNSSDENSENELSDESISNYKTHTFKVCSIL
jgi:hypothetical protein